MKNEKQRNEKDKAGTSYQLPGAQINGRLIIGGHSALRSWEPETGNRQPVSFVTDDSTSIKLSI